MVSRPTQSPAHPPCGETDVKDLVNSFLVAFNNGDAGHLDKLISTGAFLWWSTDAPGQRYDPDARDRSTLIAYFADRHLHQDRLVLLSFRFNGLSAELGNFEFTLVRSANDGAARTPYGGKGAMDCWDRPFTLSVWSMARTPST